MKPLQKQTYSPKEFIVYEDTHILVCHKPANMAVETKSVAQKDLESVLKNYLALSSSKLVYLATINRLDQPVEGLILFAKTKEAAGILSRQLNQNLITKEYVAILSGIPKKLQGTLKDYLINDKKSNRSLVTSSDTKEARLAELSYEVIATLEQTALARIQLKTGRHHQIRVQFSHLGAPLLGDVKYGGNNASNLCLCSFHLSFLHPVTEEPMDFSVFPHNVEFSRFSHIFSE